MSRGADALKVRVFSFAFPEREANSPFPSISQMTSRKLLLLGALLVCALPLHAASSPEEVIFAGEAYAMQRTAQTADHILNDRWGNTGDLFPFETVDGGVWRYSGWGAWPSGFFAGVLWHYADSTRDADWADRARQLTTTLSGWQTKSGDHDIGFNLLSSFGRGYDITGLDSDREALVTGANTFSNAHWMPEVGSLWSFNFNWGGSNGSIRPAGSSRVQGPIRARQNVIIDTSMNIELLFLGARLGGDTELWERGRSHMRNVVRDMVREDGGTIQVVDYWMSDQYENGELVAEAGDLRGAHAWQGYSNESTWSRGQGWALHGLASAYRETGDPVILEGLLRTAEYYLRETPDDGVPYWDYDAATIDDQGWLDHYAGRDLFARDSSAAAIAAAGLLELARMLDDPAERRRYFDYAERILVSLSTPDGEGGYLSLGTDYESILTQGTYTFAGYEKGLTWGDFYYIQAVQRYREIVNPPARWSADTVAGATERWARVPLHVWTVRSHAGRSAMGTAHGRYTDGPGGEPLAVALLDTPVTGDLVFSVDVAAAENLEIRPDTAARVLFNWTDAANHDYFKLSATPGESGVYRRAAGTDSQITSVAEALLRDHSWRSVTLARSGTQYTVTVDGAQVASTALTGAPAQAFTGVAAEGQSVFFAGAALDADTAPETFAVWADLAIADPAQRNAADDANGDGAANVLYYLAGTPSLPAASSRGNPLDVTLHPGEESLGITFHARVRSDYGVTAEYSPDLWSWQPLPTRPVPDTLPDANGRRAMEAVAEPAADGFFRLRVDPRAEAP